MNEMEWAASTDPPAMIKSLIGLVSDRKFRLFAAAGCRRVADFLKENGHDLLGENNNGAIVEAIEQGADAVLGEVGMSLTASDFGQVAAVTGETLMIREAAHAQAPDAASNVAFRAPRCFVPWSEGDKAIADVVREVIGNPFQLKAKDTAAASASVQEFAMAIYATRHFTDLPELARKLEAAGCTDKALLAHLRAPGPHYRGCWALDRILDKG
jgi:hypothetical protein